MMWQLQERIHSMCFAGSANFAQAGASLGVMLKTKDKDLKQIAYGGNDSGIFSWNHRTCNLWVNLKYKKPMYGVMAGVLLVVSLLVFLVLKPMKWGIQIFLLYQSSVKLF